MTPAAAAAYDELSARQAAAGAVRGEMQGVDCALHFGDAAAERAALLAGAGVVHLCGRTQIELLGEDRAKFLHNLSTNDVRNLKPGEGCETFLCNAQGKILFHLVVYCRTASLVLETVPGQGETLLAHLDRYLIREKVELHDRTAEWAEFLAAGPRATAALSLLCGVSRGAPALPETPLAHVEAPVEGAVLRILRTPLLAVDACLVQAPAALAADVWQRLVEAGCVPCGALAFDAARIEAGFPCYGQDITADNLPQEVGRDKRTISFVKGCYLGQETVARIDALGHVNRLLCGLNVTAGDPPAIGLELMREGKTVGKLTSVAAIPTDGKFAALGYVRRGSHEPGTRLESPAGPIEVVALPS